jgi:hypothetical protein
MTTPAPEELARRLRDLATWHRCNGDNEDHALCEAAADALSTPQSPSAPAVTEEMVDRLFDYFCPVIRQTLADRGYYRAALTAALQSPGKEGTPNG